MARNLLILIATVLVVESTDAYGNGGPGSTLFRWVPETLTTCSGVGGADNCCQNVNEGRDFQFCLEDNPLYNLLDGDLIGKMTGCASLYCGQLPDPCSGKNCSSADQCHFATCASGTGTCLYPEKQNGTPCDDSDVETEDDMCVDGTCVGTTPTDLPSTCVLHVGQAWCTHPTSCGIPCQSTCEALNMVPLSDLDVWWEAQNTPMKCNALSQALGMDGINLHNWKYGCLLEDFGGDRQYSEDGTPLLKPVHLFCSTNTECPMYLLTGVNFAGSCNQNGMLSICPCGDGLLHPQCAYRQDFTQCDDGNSNTADDYCFNGMCTGNSAGEPCNSNDPIIHQKCDAWHLEYPTDPTGAVCLDEANIFECSNAEVVPSSECPSGYVTIGMCSVIGYQCLQKFETDYGNFVLNMTFKIKGNLGVWTVVDSKTLPHETSGIFHNLATADVLFGTGMIQQPGVGLNGDFFYGVKFVTEGYGRKSCKNRCGFRGEDKCWCDDSCRYHNDCCDDICDSCGLFCSDSASHGYLEARSDDYVHKRTGGKTAAYGAVGVLVILGAGFILLFKRRLRNVGDG